MKTRDFFSIANIFIRAKIFKMKIPLAVSWLLTFNCNQKCLYCGVWQKQCRDLDTLKILNMINEFKLLGTKWISFTGGEPLLREDLGIILKHTKSKNIYVSVSSNGRLIPERIKDLKGIDRIKLSLDGPQKIHDFIRGEGSYLKVIESIELCRKNYIPVRLECVLSGHNLDYVEWIVAKGLEYKVKVLFQPATINLLGTDKTNPIITHDEKKYREAISKLIKLKKYGSAVYNSLACLNHLYHWPNFRKIPCSSGKLSFGVNPDGTISQCGRLPFIIPEKKVKRANIKEEISKMAYVGSCQQCWCSSAVEFDLVSAFNINAMVNFLRNF